MAERIWLQARGQELLTTLIKEKQNKKQLTCIHMQTSIFETE